MRKKRLGVFFILLFALVGLADAIYLAEHALSDTPLICNIKNLSGCNVVAQSPYAHLFGIPLAEYGVLFYSVMFLLTALELVLFNRTLRRLLQLGAIAGVFASVVFEGIQVFLIGALCVYCLGSAFASLFIFLSATFIEPIRRKVSAHGSAEPLHRGTLPMPPSA